MSEQVDHADSRWRTRWEQLNEERSFRRLAPSSLRAAWWALRAVRGVKRDLREGGVSARVPAPPALPWGSRTGVNGVLNRLDPTCIERSLVRQAWLLAHGVDRAVVIGVRKGAGDFKAHAWVDGLVNPAETAEYQVIHRIAPG